MPDPAPRSRSTRPTSVRRRLVRITPTAGALGASTAVAGGAATGHPVAGLITGAVLVLPGIGVVIAAAVAGRVALRSTEPAEDRIKLIQALTELIATLRR